MTRKHFKALADALKNSHPTQRGDASPDSVETWKRTCRNVADACGAFNPNFDRALFFRACTVEG